MLKCRLQLSMMICALPHGVEDLAVEELVAQTARHSSTTRSPAVARGDVGGLRPDRRDPARTALATNSGPYSDGCGYGTPRKMKRSESTSITAIALSLRSTRMARHSLREPSRRGVSGTAGH